MSNQLDTCGLTATEIIAIGKNYFKPEGTSEQALIHFVKCVRHVVQEANYKDTERLNWLVQTQVTTREKIDDEMLAAVVKLHNENVE